MTAVEIIGILLKEACSFVCKTAQQMRRERGLARAGAAGNADEDRSAGGHHGLQCPWSFFAAPYGAESDFLKTQSYGAAGGKKLRAYRRRWEKSQRTAERTMLRTRQVTMGK